MFENINFAVVGATGAVGEVMLSILSERNIPSKNIFPLASNRSLGKQVDYGNTKLDVIDLDIDFLAGSGHKLCGPTGIGFLWSRKEILEKILLFFPITRYL